MAAIQTIINMLLIGDEGGPIELNLDEVETGPFGYLYGRGGYRDVMEIQFEGQNQSVTLCFATEDIQSGEISVQLNGQSLGQLATDDEVCLTFTAGQQVNGTNTLLFVHNNPGDRWGVRNIGLESTQQDMLGLPRVSRLQWDETAVRKVLKIFAFGGHPTDAQIHQWADTNPEEAIAEMLNFSKHNRKLSPLAPGEKYTDSGLRNGTFWEFSEFLASNASNLPIEQDPTEDDYNRRRFGLDSWDREGAFVRMVTTRGMNPFRQRIGFWETNYHLAVNLDAGVDDSQLARYYDVIMNAHEQGLPYHQVLGEAAKTAAIAMQYGHRRNRWINGECLCNEDFAREIHQLFYGILGDTDPEGGSDHHENVTIKESAKMLTDMQVQWVSMQGYPDEVTFGTSEHHTQPVYILNTWISGATAADKIDNLMNVSVQHPESLQNLPIIIISGLADDNITTQKAQQIRAAWASMGANKNFLDFIHAYALSTLFHSPNNYKYLTSFERGLYMANRTYLSNTESYLNRFRVDGAFQDENVEMFEPAHNVFGGQTSQEAADAALIFELNYNRSSQDEWLYRNQADCDDCDFGQPWVKDWGRTIPTTNGQYVVEDVARWLWMHVIGDMSSYTELERAHLLPILGATRRSSNPNDDQQAFFDLNHLLCIRQARLDDNETDVSLQALTEWGGYGRYCTPNDGGYDTGEQGLLSQELNGTQIGNTAYIQNLLNEIGSQTMPLGNGEPAQLKLRANERIQHALSFIFATPFIFAEEGN